MNRIELPKSHADKRRRREVPAQLELTLPRGPLPASSRPCGPEDGQPEAEGPQTDRGVAVVDFYI